MASFTMYSCRRQQDSIDTIQTYIALAGLQAIHNVVTDAHVEQPRLLHDHTHTAPIVLHIPVLERHIVDQDGSRLWLVEALQQCNDG